MTEISELAATMDYLKSRMDILDCINRYARIVDRFDRAAVPSVFHEDAVLDYGVLVGGPLDFVEYFVDLHARFHISTNHMIANHHCEIDGDVAFTETYFAVANNNREGQRFTLAGGRYIDQFERRGGRWAIARRKCVAEWDATPGTELVAKLNEVFVHVGKVCRDGTDVSYERPITIASSRLGTSIPV